MATAPQFTGCKSCPTCGRKFTTPKGSDKKLAQDLEKAWAAIAVLESFPADSPAMAEAIALEMVRMRRALVDHSLLWRIYRRADKATGYGISLVRGAQ
jgi:hypothetical protein